MGISQCCAAWSNCLVLARQCAGSFLRKDRIRPEKRRKFSGLFEHSLFLAAASESAGSLLTVAA